MDPSDYFGDNSFHKRRRTPEVTGPPRCDLRRLEEYMNLKSALFALAASAAMAKNGAAAQLSSANDSTPPGSTPIRERVPGFYTAPDAVDLSEILKFESHHW